MLYNPISHAHAHVHGHGHSSRYTSTPSHGQNSPRSDNQSHCTFRSLPHKEGSTILMCMSHNCTHHRVYSPRKPCHKGHHVVVTGSPSCPSRGCQSQFILKKHDVPRLVFVITPETGMNSPYARPPTSCSFVLRLEPSASRSELPPMCFLPKKMLGTVRWP